MIFLFLYLISPPKADWSADIPIASGYTSYPNQHNIVCDANGEVHTAWFCWDVAQCYSAKYKHYTGTQWIDETRVSSGAGSGILVANPAISINKDSEICTIWQSNYKYSDIVIRRFSGGAWEDSGIFISYGIDYNYTPSIACDSAGVFHIVWQNKYEIYYRKLNGDNLSSRIEISNSGLYSAYPCIETSGNKLFVVWEDLRDGNFEIYLKEFDGNVWKDAIRVTYSEWASVFPCFCIDYTGKLNIVWQEEQNSGYKIFYTSYFNGNFGAIETLVSSPGEAVTPSIVSKGNNLYLVWADSRDGDWEIYYKEYNGTAWEQDTRLTFAPGTSANPEIAVSNTEDLYLLFWDVRDDTAKVYFKERVGFKKSRVQSSVRLRRIRVYPNPSTTGVRVQWSGISEKQKFSLQIYDLSGRLVRTLIPNPSSLIPAVEWDGTDKDGAILGSGIYFLKTPNVVKKIVLIR